MRSNTIFRGSAVAIITPFNENGIDFEAFKNLIEFQIANKTSAIVVCGTTGEPSTMTKDEKKAVIEFCIKTVNKRVPVIAGAGSNNTADAVAAAITAYELGADALLVVTPYYNKCTVKGLVAHYQAISDATPLPIIVYNVPGRTGYNITVDALNKLCEVKNVAAIKEASGNMDQITGMCASCLDKIDFYSGDDALTLPMLVLGAKGVISVAANIIPSDMQKICDEFFAGSVSNAATLQLKTYPLIKALFSEVNPIPVKTAAALMGLCKPLLRLPLTNMEDASYAKLINAMKAYGIRF